MREQPDFTGEFESALSQTRTSVQLEKIERRVCESDKYKGAEYQFYGYYVPILPLIDVAADLDGFAIESMSYNNELDKPFFQFFLADCRQQQSHPAFIR